MIRSLTALVLTALLLAVSGCASDKLNTDYLKARATASLKVPAGMSLPAPTEQQVEVGNLSPEELKSINTQALFMPPKVVDTNTPDASEATVQHKSLGTLKVDDNGSVYLQIALRYDEAWSRVRLGLMSSGFTITDMNRSEGKVYLRYRDPESDKDKPEQLVLNLLDVAGGSRLLVRSQDGKILTGTSARHILKLVNDNL